MIPATFSTIFWRIPTFQNKPAKNRKSPQPYQLVFLEVQGTGKLWKGHALLVSHLQMVFISCFKIIQGTSIDPYLQICSQISPFLNTCIYKFGPWPLRIFRALLYTDTLCFDREYTDNE